MDPRADASRRRLLDGDAGRLFGDVVETGLLPLDDPRCEAGHPSHEAVTALVELGLLQLDEERAGYVPVDPSIVQSGMVAPIGRRAMELLAESAAWAETLASLGRAYRQGSVSSTPLTELRSTATVNRYLEVVVDDAREELLTAQPRGARMPAELGRAVNRDIRALDRGVKMRTLYQHTARSSRATRDYVLEMITHGAQVRTLDEFFNRLIVIDRRLAIIPGAEPGVALAVEEPTLVAYLVDLFERSWERGRDYEHRAVVKESDVAHDVRQLTVRMLAEGHSDTASAKRVGVSTRTYATYVAALKQEYGVATRFQLGWAMGSENGQSDADGG